MKTSIVPVHQAKTNLSRLLQKAAKGEEVIIARGKLPVARLIPIDKRDGSRKPGSLKGTLLVSPAFFEPLPDQEQAHWE